MQWFHIELATGKWYDVLFTPRVYCRTKRTMCHYGGMIKSAFFIVNYNIRNISFPEWNFRVPHS